MEDRVSDILAERAALDHGVATAVVVSLLLHAAGGAAALVAARRQPPPADATILNIRFAPLKPVEAKRTKVPVRPRIQEPVPAVESAAVKPQVEKNTVPLSSFGRSEKKGSENPPVKPSVDAAPAPAAPTVPVGGAGVTGLEGGDFPYTIYIERMQTLIGSRWLRPQAGMAPGIETVIRFSIQRDGAIRDAQIEVASGNGMFDRAALRAVLESSPLPPLPFGYSGSSLGVHLTFR